MNRNAGPDNFGSRGRIDRNKHSSKHDPDDYAKRLGFDRKRYRLMTLRVLEGTNLHSGDMMHLNTNLSDHQGMVEAAQKYWAGADESLPTAEVLVEGQLEIIRFC